MTGYWQPDPIDPARCYGCGRTILDHTYNNIGWTCPTAPTARRTEPVSQRRCKKCRNQSLRAVENVAFCRLCGQEHPL